MFTGLHRFLAALGFTFVPFAVQSQEASGHADGEMACEVISKTGVGIQHGKTSDVGDELGFIVGDTLSFSYRVIGSPYAFVWMELRDRSRNDNYGTARIEAQNFTRPVSQHIASIGPEFGSGHFGLDSIRLVGLASDIRLSRYSPDGWQGIAVIFALNQAQTFTLDCQTVGDDNVQAAFDAIRLLVSTLD